MVIEGVESRAGIGWIDVYSGCLVLDGWVVAVVFRVRENGWIW